MTVVLNWSDRRTRMGTLVLDVLLTEMIELPSLITMYPVEEGVTISDHIVEEPERLRLSGLVATADVSAFSFGFDGTSKLIDVVETLRALHKARAMVTISTGQLLYEDRAFGRLTATRSAEGLGGNWLAIEAELVKIRKVQLRTAEVPAEQVAPPASGRAGPTGQPAGRSTPSGSSATRSSSGAAATPTRPPPRDVSFLRGGAEAAGLVPVP